MGDLASHDIAQLRADNPGPFTLTGTNTWLIGRDPCWVVDPGPLLDAHVAAIAAEAHVRGGAGGIALTHAHADHTEAVPRVAELLGVPVAAMDFAGADVRLADGDTFGPLQAIASPGHAPDHLAFVTGTVCFTGDAVLGQGSVFVAPDPGALRGYLAALQRLRAMELDLLCPGHGPVVEDPRAKLDHYISHRLDRERRLVDALGEGLRSVDELLDRVWDDAPQALRPAAAVTLAAHLDKLAEEGRLPEGVQRPPGF
ncbi:MAG: beta-lactamase domain protein [Solirubrobacteraceae bacterium]|nr:beta-lactamase domain protein [Solirubrobacteraceae bacterium]